MRPIRKEGIFLSWIYPVPLTEPFEIKMLHVLSKSANLDGNNVRSHYFSVEYSLQSDLSASSTHTECGIT